MVASSGLLLSEAILASPEPFASCTVVWFGTCRSVGWYIIPNKMVNSTISLIMKADLSQIGLPAASSQSAASFKGFLDPDCFYLVLYDPQNKGS